MCCLTGSQCKSRNIGFTRQDLGTEYTKRTFWIRWKFKVRLLGGQTIEETMQLSDLMEPASNERVNKGLSAFFR